MNLPALDEKTRLRLGIGLAVALVWLFVLLELSEQLGEARTLEDRLQREIARNQAVAQETYWPTFRAEVHQRLDEFRAHAWREESEGLVQARFQDWLRAQLSGHALVVRDLVVALPTPLADEALAPAEIRQVRARITLDFKPDALHDWLTELAESPHWVWVERMLVTQRGNPRVEMELTGLFIIGVSGDHHR
ncbi:hypothetical protein [Ectothiorhodospira lacustris]|uniref:hypothetical protein n=1 Tax=Ectothiorhodospira lacustris TaxID=2899127 RepID=UPI001EE9794B|nr:hypothetical protein [Ectothiorhodospira lacustris]MCG5500811.1 hypothetical protein [Ectothiorhodospira lacustris]